MSPYIYTVKHYKNYRGETVYIEPMGDKVLIWSKEKKKSVRLVRMGVIIWKKYVYYLTDFK